MSISSEPLDPIVAFGPKYVPQFMKRNRAADKPLDRRERPGADHGCSRHIRALFFKRTAGVAPQDAASTLAAAVTVDGLEVNHFVSSDEYDRRDHEDRDNP